MNGKPNILVLTARADFGGGPEHIYRLIKLLHEKVRFYVACPNDYPYFEKYKELVGEDSIINIPHRKFSLPVLFKLAAFARSRKINIIHSHGKGAGIYSRLLSFFTGRACIHTFHGIHTDNYNYPNKVFYLWIERVLSHMTARFISVSAGESDKASKLKFAPADKIKLIPNGTFIPAQTASFDFDSSKTFNIITFTRFDTAKNSMLLIPVCKALQKINKGRNFAFIVVGSGEEEAEFKKRLVSENMERFFKLTGAVLDPGEYLIKSFCYISTSRWEGLPLGILEAMSYGLPIIATDVIGNRDLVEHNVNGFLFDIDNPDAAAGYIMKLALNEAEYRTLSGNGKAAAENKYSVDKMAEETYNIYMDCYTQ